MVVDSSSSTATRLTQQYPLTTSSTTSAACYGCSTTSDCSDGSPGNVDEGLRTSSSGAVFVGRPLPVDPRRRLSDGSHHQHHTAGLIDVVASDADDYVFKRDMPPPAVPVKAVPGAARLVGGVVLGQRSAACAPSSRVRGAVLAKSCGDALLKRAAVRISTSAGHSAASGRSQPSVSSRGNPPSCPAQRASGVRSASLSLPSSQLSGSAAGRVPSYLALDDHRYTLRVPPPPSLHPPPSKVQKTGSRASGIRQSASSGSLVGVTSILEAFLRTTRPIDPNKGSNAALAAAGLGHLPVGRDRGAMTRGSAADHVDVDDDGSGTLLKKLLTGEIDQSIFPARTDASSSTRSASQMDQTDTVDSGISVMDSLLAEEFALDGDFCLDDPQSMNLSLLDDDGLWISAQADDFDDKVDHHTTHF